MGKGGRLWLLICMSSQVKPQKQAELMKQSSKNDNLGVKIHTFNERSPDAYEEGISANAKSKHK